MSVKGRFFQSADYKSADTAEINRRIKAGRLLQGVLKTHNVFGKNATIQGEQLDTIRVMPAQLINPVRILENLTIRGYPSLLAARTILVQCGRLLLAQLEPTEQPQVCLSFLRQTFPCGREFFQVLVQSIGKHGVGSLERSIN